MGSACSGKIGDLKWDELRDATVHAFKQKPSFATTSENANRISNVKRKGGDPRFKSQQQAPGNQSQPSPSSSQQQPTSSGGKYNGKRGKRGGKNNYKGKQRDNSQQHGHNHGHSHLASFAAPVLHFSPSLPAPTTSTVASIGSGGISFRKVKQPEMSHTFVADNSVGPGMWQVANEAREIADHMQVSKTARNLKTLEQVAESSLKRKSELVPGIASIAEISDARIDDSDVNDDFHGSAHPIGHNSTPSPHSSPKRPRLEMRIDTESELDWGSGSEGEPDGFDTCPPSPFASLEDELADLAGLGGHSYLYNDDGDRQVPSLSLDA
ncbi:hypothetical protein BDN72DRAFT_907563, partial [Pluteus cervinus]